MIKPVGTQSVGVYCGKMVKMYIGKDITMNRVRRGFGNNMILGIIGAVVAIGIIAYIASDVFKTKVDSNLEQMTKWTPENIAKDPVNYLNFCEKQAKDAIQQLKADRISVAQSKGKLDDMRSKAQAKVDAGEKYLTNAKAAYKAADAANAWPIDFDGAKHDKEYMKAAIVKINKETETQKLVLNKASEGVKKLDAQASKIEKAQADSETQLTDITANRELLKVNKLTDDMKDRLVNMKGAVQGVLDVIGDNKASLPSLSDLSTDTKAADSAEFDKIMGN
jgi:hypothetical protein